MLAAVQHDLHGRAAAGIRHLSEIVQGLQKRRKCMTELE